MTFQALRVKIEIPRLNVTGFYKLSDSKGKYRLFETYLFDKDSRNNFQKHWLRQYLLSSLLKFRIFFFEKSVGTVSFVNRFTAFSEAYT